MCDIAPEVTIWRDSKKTRKPHVCAGCEKPIPIGSPARRWSAFDDGQAIKPFYTHMECFVW